jgi:choline dehydrogenase
MGVVDRAGVAPERRGHGMEGRRGADASVSPPVTNGHTHAPTVMIGERASDLIITALGEARPAAALSLNAEEAAL